MQRISHMTALTTVIALVFYCSVPSLAAPGATLEGTVKTPCDPSRVSDVVALRVQPVSGGPVTTVVIDASTGAFASPELDPGEYEITSIGVDGAPLSAEPTRLTLVEGVNPIVLSLNPPGCGEPEAPATGKKGSIKGWQASLIYLGVVAGAVVLLSNDDEEPASPF